MSKSEAKTPKDKEKGAKTAYNPSSIELKWQSKWKEEAVYQPDLNNAKRPFYNLMMFPYPSAEGLHVGSIFAFGGVDVYGRFKRMQGNDVFEPIGLDGFGIHSENHALKTGTHPFDHAKRTEENFYRQLRSTGISFAWDNKVETYNPGYYKWTQWLFIELFKAGLAYKKKSPVNFCPSCKTVLADEQVIDGKCERCGTVVEKRNLSQWFFKITDYAERLLNNIEGLNWTEKVKIAQRNWIGKSEGARIKFSLKNIPGQEDNKHAVEVFTTRPDTLFGATFIVISPELAKKWLSVGWKASDEVISYVEKALHSEKIEREAADREKTGVDTEILAVNPVNNEEIPVWVADYVLGEYGTGAIMAVPAHDTRDFAFARKFGLPIRHVISHDSDKDNVYVGPGKLVNSGDWDGFEVPRDIKKVITWLDEKEMGKSEVTYHLRDWLISRQRYWGPPIPMIYCESCAEKGLSWFTSDEAKKRSKGMEISNDKLQISNKPIGNWKLEIGNSSEAMRGWYPAEDLPVELPYVEDYKPMGTGKAPLANYPEFYETTCPHCGAKATRETDVSDTFLDSAWYFLRYLATDRVDVPFPSEKFFSENSEKSEGQTVRRSESQKNHNFRSSDALKVRKPEFPESSEIAKRGRFLPVTMYIGGAEHSVLHLLYARFVTMVLKDLGYLDFEEPFARFYAHGLIIKDGAKMSKSKGNVINPDEYFRKYGADAVRCYLLFLGPFNQGGDFRDTGMEGMARFLKRVWKLFSEAQISNFQFPISNEGKSMMNETIKGVTEDLEELRYNTAIAKLMIWYNYLKQSAEGEGHGVTKEEVETYLKLLAPFAPHMSEELYQMLKVSGVSKVSRVSKADEENKKAFDTPGTPDTLDTFQSIHTSPWPTFDEKAIVHETTNLAVQVNGKLRAVLLLDQNSPKDEKGIRELAEKDPAVAKFLEGKSIKKVIYVVGKILNFVVG